MLAKPNNSLDYARARHERPERHKNMTHGTKKNCLKTSEHALSISLANRDVYGLQQSGFVPYENKQTLARHYIKKNRQIALRDVVKLKTDSATLSLNFSNSAPALKS